MSEQRESCSHSSGLPGRVDRVRDQKNEGSTGSFVYIECDQVRKCIRLPPDTPSSFGPESHPHSILFSTGQVICGGWKEKEERQREGRVICSGRNSTVK